MKAVFGKQTRQFTNEVMTRKHGGIFTPCVCEGIVFRCFVHYIKPCFWALCWTLHVLCKESRNIPG